MNKKKFKLNALTVSVMVCFSGAVLANTVPYTKDTVKLSNNVQGEYSGGSMVAIGGNNLVSESTMAPGDNWLAINPDTAGFKALVESSGYTGYLDLTHPTLAGDVNYPLDETYQRAMHGERLVHAVGADKTAVPVGVVHGLKMGNTDARYQKTQTVTLYQRDASGIIQYQKDADGKFSLDTKGNKIPLTVSKTLILDQNPDVVIHPVAQGGGEFGLQDARIYSQVKSVNSTVGAVDVRGNLQENTINDRARDVLTIKNSLIDNTLNSDAERLGASGSGKENNGHKFSDEHDYSKRPFATGLSIISNSVDYGVDSAGKVIAGKQVLTHQVATVPNIILDNTQVIAQNLAAVRSDNHDRGPGYKNDGSYRYDADKNSTAVFISGSGLFASVKNNSVLTGGVNNAGYALKINGHANRVDVNSSTLNGDVQVLHDGYQPVINVTVQKDAKTGEYTATGASVAGASPLDRTHNGTALNITNNSVVNGNIYAGGDTAYAVQLTDVTDPKAVVILTPQEVSGSPSANGIYNNAINSINQTLITNSGNAWTPVSVALDHSTLNGSVSGITRVAQPDGSAVISMNPDLSVKNGAVWNAAATGKGGLVQSHVHDLNLSGSTLNLVNLDERTATLGDRGRYQDLSSARVTVHGNLTQDKDAKGQYQGSVINIGKAVVDPLINLGGDYVWGSMQVRGTAQGNYQLRVASSGVEPHALNGLVASPGETSPHSFVNYLEKGSDAHFTGRTELGAWQYAAADVSNDTVHGERNVYFKKTGELSNSAATALSMAASQVNVAEQESDALNQHFNASRHARDEGGVWVSYFGGKSDNKTNAGAAYDVRTNGVMVGVDNLFDAKGGGSWLGGLAFSSARSDVKVMNSSGDLDSYGAQFYLSRRFENGVFVDTAAQFTHFSNSGDAHMLDGQRSRSDFSTNGYGLGMKIGYAWQYEGFFADPYIKATGRTFDGMHYTMNNGMVVKGDDYKSLQGEIGADVGYTFEIQQGYVKPYLHLAAINEFADSNEMKINNHTFNNSIDNAAFQIGTGAEVKLMQNVGGYASFTYTKGNDIERPWQANVGVNYSW